MAVTLVDGQTPHLMEGSLWSLSQTRPPATPWSLFRPATLSSLQAASWLRDPLCRSRQPWGLPAPTALAQAVVGCGPPPTREGCCGAWHLGICHPLTWQYHLSCSWPSAADELMRSQLCSQPSPAFLLALLHIFLFLLSYLTFKKYGMT